MDCEQGYDCGYKCYDWNWGAQDQNQDDGDEDDGGQDSLEEFQRGQLRTAREDWDSFKPP